MTIWVFVVIRWSTVSVPFGSCSLYNGVLTIIHLGLDGDPLALCGYSEEVQCFIWAFVVNMRGIDCNPLGFPMRA